MKDININQIFKYNDTNFFIHSLHSPSQGPCCAHDCRLTVGNKCRDDNGCRTASYCKYPFHTNVSYLSQNILHEHTCISELSS